MGIVRLGTDGSVEVLKRSTPEDAARAQEELLDLATLLADRRLFATLKLRER